MLLFLFMFQIVAALKTEQQNRATSQSMAKSGFTPSSLPLYPLDFQDVWQASRPIPLDINYSVPNYGPQDLVSYLEKLSGSGKVLESQLHEREWQQNNVKAAEDRKEILFPFIRQRISYAHRR